MLAQLFVLLISLVSFSLAWANYSFVFNYSSYEIGEMAIPPSKGFLGIMWSNMGKEPWPHSPSCLCLSALTPAALPCALYHWAVPQPALAFCSF